MLIVSAKMHQIAVESKRGDTVANLFFGLGHFFVYDLAKFLQDFLHVIGVAADEFIYRLGVQVHFHSLNYKPRHTKSIA